MTNTTAYSVLSSKYIGKLRTFRLPKNSHSKKVLTTIRIRFNRPIRKSNLQL